MTAEDDVPADGPFIVKGLDGSWQTMDVIPEGAEGYLAPWAQPADTHSHDDLLRLEIRVENAERTAAALMAVAEGRQDYVQYPTVDGRIVRFVRVFTTTSDSAPPDEKGGKEQE